MKERNEKYERFIILKDNDWEYSRIEKTFRLINNHKQDQKGVVKMLNIKNKK